MSKHQSGHYDLIVEETLKYFRMRGYCEVNEVELEPHFRTPTDVINTNQDWSVRLYWETDGALNCLMDGTWKCRVYLEQFGEGEYKLPDSEVIVDFHSAPHKYDVEMPFKPGSVKPGVYKGVATIQMCGPKGHLGPIVAYCELGWLHFYDSKPFIDVDNRPWPKGVRASSEDDSNEASSGE